MTTSDDHQHSNRAVLAIKSNATRYTWAGYYFFVLISSLVGDTTILIASLRYRAFNLQRALVVIIHHMAFCDLMVTVTTVIPSFVSLIGNGWEFGNFLCNLTPYITYYFNGASILLICNMTTSKLFLLKYPLRGETVSVKRARAFCGACWLAALIVPVAFLLVAILDGENVDFSYKSYFCEYGFTSSTWIWLKPLLAVIIMVTPNCLVVATTIYLLIIAKHVALRGRECLKWQGIMTTILTATVHSISVLPIAVYNFVDPFIAEDDESNSFFYTPFFRIALSFSYLNTISNFYIYSLSVHSFRDFLRSRLQRAYRMFTRIGTSASQGKGI